MDFLGQSDIVAPGRAMYPNQCSFYCCLQLEYIVFWHTLSPPTCCLIFYAITDMFLPSTYTKCL